MSSFQNWIRQYQLCVDFVLWDAIDYGLNFYTNSTMCYNAGALDKYSDDIDTYICPEFIFYGIIQMYNRYQILYEGKPWSEIGKDKETQKDYRRLSGCYNKIAGEEINRLKDFVCDRYFPGQVDPSFRDVFNSILDCFDDNLEKYLLGDNKHFVTKIRQLLSNAYNEGRKVTIQSVLHFCMNYVDTMNGNDIDVDTYNLEFTRISQYYSNLRKQLAEVVICQDSAVRKFVQGLFAGRLSKDTDRKGPESCFLFVGPPGVGKTFLAKSVAKFLDREYKVFQMNEYADKNAYSGLVGFAQTWKNSKEGELTGFVAAHPNAVIVFDEIEKAHLNTIHQFLSVLEGGFLRDIYTEKDVDFTNTILIFTTNAGRDFYEEKRDQLISSIPESTIIDALKNDKKADGTPLMPTEILSRLAKGNIIGFDHMNPAKLIPIIKKGMQEGKDIVQSKLGLSCEYDESVLPYIFLYHLGSQLDARVASTRSGEFIKECMFYLAERIGEDSARYDEVNASNVTFQVEDDEVARNLTIPDRKSEILLVSYKKDRDKFAPDANDRFIRYDAWDQQDAHGNQVKIAEMLKEHNIAAILIDPFMTGKTMTDVSDELEGLMHMNTHGNNVLQWLLKQKDIPPVYAIELRNRISLVDQLELQRQGVKGILNLIGLGANACKEVINNLVYELFLAAQLDKLTSKGRSLEFDIGHKFEKNGIILRLHNFRLIVNMSTDVVDVVVGDSEKPNICFDDVIGAESAKEELRHFIKFIKDPETYKKSGLQVSKGILLYGPPGTGKTILAKALASEADCPFIATTGAQFVNGTKDISDVFRLARKYAPSVVFIDEIDSFALNRTQTDSGRATILNNLLTEMDGFSTTSSKPVFVIAATNAAKAPGLGGNNIYLDGALQRRFTKKVYVDLPDRENRFSYLQKCKEKYKEKMYSLNGLSDEDLNEFSTLTAGHSLAEIENVINLTIGRAAELDEEVSKELLIACFEESVYGEKMKISEEHLMTTALHEAGHAFVGFESGERFYPEYATLVARANYLGMVQQTQNELHYGYSKGEYLKWIRIKLAGRAAELVLTD